MWKIHMFLYFLLFISVCICNPVSKKYKIQHYNDDTAVKIFQEYLRIDTSREENIKYAVEFWKRQASEVGLHFAVYEPSTKPICVITWYGSEPSLPSIMLNSHMDVVTVDEASWTYPPFSAQIDEDGNIYARGTQDTKDVGIQYLEAIRKLIRANITLQRTVHITLMPDEETGGFHGIKPFIETEEFKALNVGFALDEGLPSVDDTVYATYQDKRPWQMKFTFHGESGHGSSMPDGTAVEKANKLMNIVTNYREKQKNIMKNSNDFGAYDSVNINIINGGLVPNIIPGELVLVVDMRLSTKTDVEELQTLVDTWVAEAGNGTSVEFLRRDERSEATPLDDSNEYWTALQDAAADMGIKILPIVCPATTDMLVLRNINIPAIGIAPKTYTVSRAHGNDEYINVGTFMWGINFYVEILKRLGKVASVE